MVLRQGDQFGEPVGDGEVRGLHPEDEHAPAAAGHARERRLARIEQPAVGRVQARLRDGADRTGRGLEVVEQDRGGRLVAGPLLQPHPCLGDHAQRALRSQEQSVGGRARARTGYAQRLVDADRGDHAQGLGQIVDVGEERGVVAAGPGRQPAAEGGELEALRKVAQGQPVRPQLGFEVGPEHARLDPRRPAGGVDVEHAVEGGEVERDHAAAPVPAVLHSPDHRTARSVGHDDRVRALGPVQEVHDVLLAAGEGDLVRCRTEFAAQGPYDVAVGLAVGVGGPVRRGVGHQVGEGGRRADPGLRQIDAADVGHRQRGVGRTGDQRAEGGALAVGQGLVLGAPAPPGTAASGRGERGGGHGLGHGDITLR